ncbi:hypothetical protein M431DRAFT_335092 [Trichoderma harzianum CBS 226.95]|uniref:Uncharacterized protein n=1 Tax=Trichoderma harzianum CBS 226.95 TaxID=983964 RepID=A0A2T3ZTD4_TRIHA|nr:hypothetical protein M431DRAFT_335092 [Trichoderma harzianum CBS 226.95]PTB48064.1 hypothetical protein M431DRAFT_335092 [Trichoderma harzianum CBS 226.95]
MPKAVSPVQSLSCTVTVFPSLRCRISPSARCVVKCPTACGLSFLSLVASRNPMLLQRANPAPVGLHRHLETTVLLAR